ncbi:hypothetical protein [Allokutzneria albata]|uniref:Uncharacterized protein n=1 Tax=Allokutzneria albata TaxID=211114 RepID=A0A1G9SR70_ALLAB|nr:hypothetical protein [Allokutzneria albata]SDM37956.1 hypothetical protein SAMN04489726_1334 [Allokutzneria albata]
MGRQYRYFALSNHKLTANSYDVLRKNGEREEVFIALEGWRPRSASDRSGASEHEIDERRAHLIIDWNTGNRFMPLDRPFRYFALTDGEHPPEDPVAVVRRWADEHGDQEDMLVSMREWTPGVPFPQDGLDAVLIDAAEVDRLASVMEERRNGFEFYHYLAIVNDEHDVDDPVTVVRERPATGEIETYTAGLKWEPGGTPGKRVPITALAAREFTDSTMPERVREEKPYRYYAILIGDHAQVTAPDAVVRQKICPRCLHAEEVYRPGGRWVATNAVMQIRAGERPGRVVPISEEVATALRETRTPKPVLEREPAPRTVYRYYAVVSDDQPVDDPLTVVRVRDDIEEAYTPTLWWERATPAGERVPISASAALRFEETQFRRVFGEVRFQYYVAVNVFHPDPDDPAAVVRSVTDDLGVVLKENYSPDGQWTHVPWPDERALVPVSAGKAPRLREICDARRTEPLYYYRGRLSDPSQDTPETLTRYWDDLGNICAQYFRNGRWNDIEASFYSSSDTAHRVHPIGIDAVRRFEAQGNHDTPEPEPVREYTYYALTSDDVPRPAPFTGLIRVWSEGKREREERFSSVDRSWSTSYVREDYRYGKEEVELIAVSEAETSRVQDMLVARWQRFQTALNAYTYYAITDATHSLRDPVAFVRIWPTVDGERIEEYVRGSGYGKWEPRRGRPAGDAVELTEALRHRLEKRAYERFERP